jgi:transcription antitermination factor NusG
MTYSELNKLSIEELRNLNSKVVEIIKLKRSEIALDIKDELRIGMNVSVNHPKLNGKQLRVEKINRTKAVLSVLNTNYGRPSQVSVPLSMIQING